MAIAQDNTLGNLGSILGAIPGLSQAVNGSSETTSNSGISSTGLNALLQQILSSTNGLASVAGGQNTAGLYNSTVQQQSVNDLLTRTAGEVAAKGPTSTTTTKAPTLSLGDTLLQGAAGMIGTKLLSKGVDSLGSTVSDALGLGATTNAGGAAAASSLLGSSTAGSLSGFSTALSGGVPEAVANAGIAGSAASEASAGAAGITGAGSSVGGGIGLTGAGALDAGLGAGLGITGAATGAATAGGLAAGGATLGGLGGAVVGDVAASTAGIAAAEGVGSAAAGSAAGFGIGDALTAIGTALAWVVCTELESTGEMSHESYTKAAPDFISRMHLKPSAVRGYHYWAIPYTRIMRRKDWIGRLARTCMRPIANGRAAMIVSGRVNFWGWVSFKVIEPVCSLLGNTVARRPQDWKSLYAARAEEK